MNGIHHGDHGERWNFMAAADGAIEMRLIGHTGRELARFIPVLRRESEELKVVFTHHGHGRYSLKVDWLPVLAMIPGWPWRWFRIKREIRNLWWMLRR